MQPARAASTGCSGSRSTPYVSPYARVGVDAALFSCSRPAARRSCRCGSALTSSAVTPSRCRNSWAPPGPQLAVGDQGQRGTLRDGSAEKPVGGGTGQQREHRGAARRFAEDRHPVGVAAERRDVPLDPAQSGELVPQRKVVVESIAEIAELESAENAYAVSDVDDHDVPVRRQPRAVVQLKLTRAEYERTAGDPDHHRQRSRRVRRPHRQRQTRLVANLRVVAATADERLALRRQRPVLDGIAKPRPRGKRARRQKPSFAYGLFGVRNAAPHRNAVLGRTAQIPRFRVHDGGMSGNNCHTRIVVCKACSA